MSLRDIRVSDRALAEALTVRVDTTAGGVFGPERLGDVAECTGIMPSRTLRPGESARVTLTVSMAASATAGEDQVASMNLAVSLTDQSVTIAPGTCTPEAVIVPVTGGSSVDAGALAHTGGDAQPILLTVVGFGGILAGVMLLGRRTRTRAGRDTPPSRQSPE